ncbi:Enolase [Citrus sinensis]|uniref:Enolase n=1 Tax=Citrus sinensis TaxID=2711 RepID=A0ACB8JU39_CITSI|nr:Enolase [Citrus sinensis]
MPYVQPSKKYSDSAANMNSESRQSSKQQQNAKAVKERVPSRQENLNLKYQSKLKVKSTVGTPCGDLPQELRREADGRILVQPNSFGNHQLQYLKGKAIKDDELVKYMSKLPGYLKRMEGGKNIQGKALDVGVLDWARLEEWKFNKKCTMTSGSNNASANTSSLLLKTTTKASTFSSATQGGMHAHQSEQHPLLCPGLNASRKDGHSQGVKPSSQKALNFQNFETSSKSNLGEQGKIPWINKSFDRNNADVTPRKGKTKDYDQKIASEMGNLSMDLGNYGFALNTKEKESSWDGEVEKRKEEAQVSKKNRKALDKTFADMETSYPKSRSNGHSLGSKEKISAGNVETKIAEKVHESNIDLGHQHLPGELENIVLLFPKGLSQNRSRKECGVPKDENLVEANQNCLSGGRFPPVKRCSVDRSFDIPHSCPLPSEVEGKIKPNLMAHNLSNSQRAELSSDASHSSQYSSTSSAMLSDCEDAEQNTVKHVKENADENLNSLDQEMAVTRSRNQSPSRRFSFSLSRMGRSFSWKESSAVPQLSSSYVSVKSGPVKSEEVSYLDDSSRQKTYGHNRARSSPLRRILDPLLRSKSSNRGHAAETVHPFKGNLSSLNFRPVFDSASLPNKKHEAATTQALLQLTMKNGLPLFKFVVDNNCSVLAATVKNLTSGKDDSGQHYTFYSVNEIKKKAGGWISQGSKQKSCGFVYNVIGQMVSRYHLSNPKSQNLKYMVRESVLFGVELKQVDQASPKVLPDKELAAVVVKMPIESLSHDAEQRYNDMTEKVTKCAPLGRCSYSGEIDNSCSTTVILPIGVHGLPKKGAPSPLIQRWKSGGLCDCGGWDVGCKLRILANHNQSCRRPMSLSAFPNSDNFELFEGLTQQSRPIFSMVPLNKEIYSVEFNTSVSLLQAFFISITVLSGQQLSDLSEVNSLYESEAFREEPMMNEKGTKESSLTNIVLGKMPAKYTPNPPHSPVGRV